MTCNFFSHLVSCIVKIDFFIIKSTNIMFICVKYPAKKYNFLQKTNFNARIKKICDILT